MNIAFQAVAIFVLALPGIAFRRYYTPVGHFRTHRPVTDEIAKSLVAAGVAHALWVPLTDCVGWLFGLQVDLTAALFLIAGRLGDQSDSIANLKSVSEHPVAVSSYFGTLLLICVCMGRKVRKHRQKRHGAVKAILLCADDDESQARRLGEWAKVLPGSLEWDASENVAVLVVASLVLGPKGYLYAGFLPCRPLIARRASAPRVDPAKPRAG